jgi:hypothetical protein
MGYEFSGPRVGFAPPPGFGTTDTVTYGSGGFVPSEWGMGSLGTEDTASSTTLEEITIEGDASANPDFGSGNVTVLDEVVIEAEVPKKKPSGGGSSSGGQRPSGGGGRPPPPKTAPLQTVPTHPNVKKPLWKNPLVWVGGALVLTGVGLVAYKVKKGR